MIYVIYSKCYKHLACDLANKNTSDVQLWGAFQDNCTQSFAKLLYVALRFSQINLTEKMRGIQGLMCHFSKNQKPGQSCHPSIGLMAVLKQKYDEDFKKVVT